MSKSRASRRRFDRAVRRGFLKRTRHAELEQLDDAFVDAQLAAAQAAVGRIVGDPDDPRKLIAAVDVDPTVLASIQQQWPHMEIVLSRNVPLGHMYLVNPAAIQQLDDAGNPMRFVP